MRKNIFSYFLYSILVTNTFGKNLEFINSSNLYMDFKISDGVNGCIVKANPATLQIPPKQQKTAILSISGCDEKQSNTAGITVFIKPSRGGATERYLAQFVNTPTKDWDCSNENERFPYYCYYMLPPSNKEFSIEADPDHIIVSDVSAQPTTPGFYNFYDDTEDEFFSIYFLKTHQCWALQPKSKNNLSEESFFHYCPTGNCQITIHQGIDCKKGPMGRMELNKRMTQSHQLIAEQKPDESPQEPHRISYEKSLEGGEDIHIAKTILYSILNTTNETPVVNFNNSECVIADNLLMLIPPRQFHIYNLCTPYSLWDYCKKDRNACRINVYQTIKEVHQPYKCGNLIGSVILDVDKGIASIKNETNSKFYLKYQALTESTFEQIEIKTK